MFGFYSLNPLGIVQREMEQLLRGFDLGPVVRRDHGRISFRIREQENDFLVEAALPGVDPEKLEINVVERKLTVTGEFVAPELPEDVRIHRQERRTGTFEQALMLSDKLDTDRIEAEYKDGMLRIGIPKVKAELPKKIEIKAG